MVSGKRKDGGGWARFLITLVVLLLLMTGTLAGLFFYLQYLLTEEEREGFTENDLLAPSREYRNLSLEDPPLYISSGQTPPFSCRLLWPINGTSERLDAIPGIGSVLNLSLKNEGFTRIYVESISYSTGWGTNAESTVGKYVEPGTHRYLRHILIPVPDPAPGDRDLSYQLFINILVNGTDSWKRKEDLDFERSRFNLIPLAVGKVEPEYVENRPYYFDRVNGLIENEIDGLKLILDEWGLLDGNFTIQDIPDAFEAVSRSLEYRSDPDTGTNEWISPLTCLARGGGDCEDYSVLLGAVITCMGGNARVIITSHHAFNAVYIGNDTSILELINERYGMEIPFQILKDDLGSWLIIEPQSYLVFGWFPSDVVVQKGLLEHTSIVTNIYGNNVFEWVYENSDEVSVVDIYI